MYFFNARLAFKIPQVPTIIPGSIIAASAIAAVDLEKRKFGKYTHLKRKYLDPQLYMASVDPALDSNAVAKLASYPWFHRNEVPQYDSDEYDSRRDWKKQHKDSLVSKWTRSVPTEAAAIRTAARAAVEYQLAVQCDGILLPAPLTTMADQTLQSELAWIDAGIQACRDLKVAQPTYATVALSEAVLHVPALKNPLIHSFSNQIASRTELAGAYVVLEQSEADSYFWTSKDPLMSLLILVDDICRGAGKKVIVNYVGTFGIVASAVGAEVWSTGYYLTQRRFSLRAKTGRAHPRYHSLSLAGDIGLKEDLARIRKLGVVNQFMSPTGADAVLRSALHQHKTPADVPQWKYAQSNCAAAQQHYLELAADTGAKLESMSLAERRRWVLEWLEGAVRLVEILEKQAIGGSATDLRHQRVWSDVFKEWRSYAKQ